jgi:hypothetical protein
MPQTGLGRPLVEVDRPGLPSYFGDATLDCSIISSSHRNAFPANIHGSSTKKVPLIYKSPASLVDAGCSVTSPLRRHRSAGIVQQPGGSGLFGHVTTAAPSLGRSLAALAADDGTRRSSLSAFIRVHRWPNNLPAPMWTELILVSFHWHRESRRLPQNLFGRAAGVCLAWVWA